MSVPLVNRHAFGSEQSRALATLTDFGPNPGALTGQLFKPADLRDGAPLVVVLHGCTQSGVAYAKAAGWFGLAEQHGFAVLVPQQQRANNGNLCFNWFEPGDIDRGSGEVASIALMVDRCAADCRSDRTQIFVTGLSAGAAMSCALLATYPEVFAGGGLIAGLPFGVATSVLSAMQHMRKATGDRHQALASNVRKATSHDGPWPRISIWHGSADRIVAIGNAMATVRQWLSVHGIETADSIVDTLSNGTRQRWHNRAGTACVEYVEVPGMGHGTPIDVAGRKGAETAAPYVLDVSISSSTALIDFWGIASSIELITPGLPSAATATARLTRVPLVETAAPSPSKPATSATTIETIINEALRKAGLLS